VRPLGPWCHFVAASLIITATLIVLKARNRTEIVPQHRELASFPRSFDRLVSTDIPLSPGELSVLGPGDFLLRDYDREGDEPINLFLAYYASQRSGDTIHSPRNCLPGAGWTQLKSGEIQIHSPGLPTVTINRYVVGNGDERMLILYWYSAHGRVTSSEYAAKFFLVADAIRLNRTDGALIRVSVSFHDKAGETQAEKRAVQFVQSIAPLLESYVPR
jgi:EpsI family protein